MDKSTVRKTRRISLLGQKIDSISADDLYQEIIQASQKRQKTFFFAINVNILVELSRNRDFSKMHVKATRVFPDGTPLVWLSWLMGKPLKERVSGTDLEERILKNRQIKVFALGSQPEVLRKLRRKFSHSIVGAYSPPFKKSWGVSETTAIISMINRSKSQVVMVGLGTYKQEKWLIDHLPQTKAVVGMGVGSAFDILSGTKKRAPGIMKNNGFEWLWRIFLEPRRLWMRYIKDAVIFGFLLIKFYLKK